MKRITTIRTFDGKIHLNEDDATRYLDKLYGDELTRLAHGLVRAEKYVKISDFIDTHLLDFVRLSQIKADITIEPEAEAE